MGRLSLSHAAMRGALMSTTVTLISGHCDAITAIVGPPTYPAPMQAMCFLNFRFVICRFPPREFSYLLTDEKTMSAMSRRTQSIAAVSAFRDGYVQFDSITMADFAAISAMQTHPVKPVLPIVEREQTEPMKRSWLSSQPSPACKPREGVWLVTICSRQEAEKYLLPSWKPSLSNILKKRRMSGTVENNPAEPATMTCLS